MADSHEHPDQVEDLLEVLRAEGGRVTTPRRLIIRGLVEANGHLTAEELAESIHALAPDVNLSTIYRNLDELERLGLVEHSHLGHGPATYHLTTAAHGHLVCEICGQMIEADDELFAELAAKSLQRYGFVIDAHHFAVLGRCGPCASASAG